LILTFVDLADTSTPVYDVPAARQVPPTPAFTSKSLFSELANLVPSLNLQAPSFNLDFSVGIDVAYFIRNILFALDAIFFVRKIFKIVSKTSATIVGTYLAWQRPIETMILYQLMSFR
jgi:hypothetical protein